jgi:hypothetical protein
LRFNGIYACEAKSEPQIPEKVRKLFAPRIATGVVSSFCAATMALEIDVAIICIAL